MKYDIGDMQMKIDGIHLTQITAPVVKETPDPQENTQIKPVEHLEMKVDVDLLEKGQKELESFPMVNQEKVEHIKKALQRGELSLDMAVLSQAIRDFYK